MRLILAMLFAGLMLNFGATQVEGARRFTKTVTRTTHYTSNSNGWRILRPARRESRRCCKAVRSGGCYGSTGSIRTVTERVKAKTKTRVRCVGPECERPFFLPIEKLPTAAAKLKYGRRSAAIYVDRPVIYMPQKLASVYPF